jgi:hypothetical protein
MLLSLDALMDYGSLGLGQPMTSQKLAIMSDHALRAED